MKRLLLLLSLAMFVALCPVVNLGQSQNTLEVIRNVNLRHDPSTANAAIELLRPPATVTLIDPDPLGGYYHVRVDAAVEGWVWSRNVRLVGRIDSIDTIMPDSLVSEPTSTGVAQHVSKSWKKYIPEESTFKGTEGNCPSTGDGFDEAQYILKNRSDEPPSYHDVAFDAIDELPFPGRAPKPKANKFRKYWQPEDFKITNPYESIPVRVEGYIIVIRDQKKSEPGAGEGTNCGFGKLGNIDAHIALVKNPNDPESTAIVIEWTPRFTKAHPNWTSVKLKPWIKTGIKVRISGWLMVDPTHLDHITGTKKYRHTLWEVHPITEIEVFQNGDFVDLDALP